MRIDTRKLGPWTQEAIELKLTPELVDLCLNVDINIVMKVDQFEFKGYDIKILPDQGIFYIGTSMIRYENLEEDLYSVRHAIMSKELTVMLDEAMDRVWSRISEGRPLAMSSHDGIITTIWTSSLFTSLSFNIALLEPSNQNKVGVQIVSGKGREFNKDLFHWVSGLDTAVEYIIEDSKNVLSHHYRDVLYSVLVNHITGYTLFDDSIMVRTPVESEVTIGQYKFISGSGDSSNTAFLVNGDSMIPLLEVFYGRYNTDINIADLLGDCFDDVLNLIYGDVIKHHATDVVIRRKSAERALSDIDKYQFITNSLNNSVRRPVVEPLEAESLTFKF